MAYGENKDSKKIQIFRRHVKAKIKSRNRK